MSDIYAGIVCIAKSEQDYIEEFVKYHLALGFKYIYLYDNEDEPTYHKILERYKENIAFFHLPGNDFEVGVQYIALHHFTQNILHQSKLTHAIHIDIDEFILLKKHKNINEFIEEYINDNCEGIGINWCFFGSSGQSKQIKEPVTQRFIRCANEGNNHIKTLYRKNNIICYGTCHDVRLKSGNIKNTNGTIIPYGISPEIAIDVIQINHYKTKTYEEFKKISKRGRADKNKEDNITLKIKDDEYINNQYTLFNRNEIEDLTAQKFYKENVLKYER